MHLSFVLVVAGYGAVALCVSEFNRQICGLGNLLPTISLLVPVHFV